MNTSELTAQDFVDVRIEHMNPLPARSNPFHYDLSSMGTSLVRGWVVMHDGFDSERDQMALRGMYLYNSRTGQRIRLVFSKMDEPTPLKIQIGHSAYTEGSNRVAVVDGVEKAKTILKLRKVSELEAEKALEKVILGHHVTVKNSQDDTIEIRAVTGLVG